MLESAAPAGLLLGPCSLWDLPKVAQALSIMQMGCELYMCTLTTYTVQVIQNNELYQEHNDNILGRSCCQS